MPKLFSGKRDIYIEVAERYEKYIRLGVLKDGDKLPSVRMAAEELGVNPNTVQKAYAHLEEAGLIYTLPKKGVFVSYAKTDEEKPCGKERANAIEALRALRGAGFSENELIDMLKEVYTDD